MAILAGADKFDLIVLSEIAYDLSVQELARVVEHNIASLAPGGSIVLCHWRAPFAQRIVATVRIPAAFQDAPGLHRVCGTKKATSCWGSGRTMRARWRSARASHDRRGGARA